MDAARLSALKVDEAGERVSLSSLQALILMLLFTHSQFGNKKHQENLSMVFRADKFVLNVSMHLVGLAWILQQVDAQDLTCELVTQLCSQLC